MNFTVPMRTLFAAPLLAVVWAVSATETQEWPSIDKGVWELEFRAQVSEASAKPSILRRRFCNNPALWFSRYPSKTPIDEPGCRFSSRRVENDKYEIKSECALLKAGTGIAIGAVKIQNSRAFDSDWEVTENEKLAYREHVRGVWREPCPGHNH